MEIKEFIGEVWSPVKGYEGLYEVSNFGRVRSVSHYINGKSGVKVWKEGRILVPKNRKKPSRYLNANLCVNKKIETKIIHRLVSEAFIPIPDHLKHIPIANLQVNHKNQNKHDNFVYVNEDGSVDFDKSNLEWCTADYNCNYGTRNERISLNGKNNPKKSDPVVQYTLDGEFIKRYPSIREAYRQTGIERRIISNICKGITKQPKQFIWKYAND